MKMRNTGRSHVRVSFAEIDMVTEEEEDDVDAEDDDGDEEYVASPPKKQREARKPKYVTTPQFHKEWEKEYSEYIGLISDARRTIMYGFVVVAAAALGHGGVLMDGIVACPAPERQILNQKIAEFRQTKIWAFSCVICCIGTLHNIA